MSTTGLKLYNAMTLLTQAVWDPTADFAHWNAVFEIVDGRWTPEELPELDELFTREHRRIRRTERRQQQQQHSEQLNKPSSEASSSESARPSKSSDCEAKAGPTLGDLGHHHLCPLSYPRNHGPRLRLGRAVTTYIFTRTWDACAQAGPIYLATHGTTVPSHTKRSLLMTNQCDWSNFVLQYVVEAVARKIDPDVTVTWKIVIPRPRYVFYIRRHNNELPGETLHSVLLLVTGRGAKYILDMSGEQFGVPREHRFLPWQAYRKRYVVRNKYWTGRAAWTLDTRNRREDCLEVDGRTPDRFWSNAQEAVERAYATWDLGKDAIGEWWSQSLDMQSTIYDQRASSLRSAVWKALSSQFNLELNGFGSA